MKKIACDIFGIPFEMMESEKIAEFKGITYMTYQTFQEKYFGDNAETVPYYHYIVADEIHYLVSDSAFNPAIQRLREWLEQPKCSVFIAISATIDKALPYLGYYDREWQLAGEREELTVFARNPRDVLNRLKGMPEYLYYYKIPRKKGTYNFYVYDDIGDVVSMINQDQSEDKWLIFRSNKQKAKKELFDKLEVTKAYISADEKEGTIMEEIIRDNKFSAKVLVATKVIDNGVSLHDGKIKNILLETTDETDFIQMLGRRRNQEEDEEPLNLFIPRMDVKYFNGQLYQNIIPTLNALEQPTEYLLKGILQDQNVGQICKKYFDVVGGKLILNPIAYDSLKDKRRFYQNLCDLLKEDENAFVKVQMKWLGYNEMPADVIWLREEKQKNYASKLVEFLESKTGILMDAKGQEEFRENILVFLDKILPEKFKKNSARSVGLNKINKCLTEIGIPYKVEAKYGKKEGQRVLWIITKEKE